jgi:hypothetical protein
LQFRCRPVHESREDGQIGGLSWCGLDRLLAFESLPQTKRVSLDNQVDGIRPAAVLRGGSFVELAIATPRSVTGFALIVGLPVVAGSPLLPGLMHPI